ncbi:MAG: HAMP domain-containing sensor histidine kinase [Candidatus Paceibacterota bacterium]
MMDLDKFKANANAHLAVARFLFLLTGIVALGIFAINSDYSSELAVEAIGTGMIFFAGAICFNALWYFFIDHFKNRLHSRSLDALGFSQVVLDLAIVTALLYLIGDPGIYGAFLFFIPIIEAVVLFNFWLPFATALIASAALAWLRFSAETGIWDIADPDFVIGISPDNLTVVTGHVAVYLLAAVFLSYNYQSVRPLKIWRNKKEQSELNPTGGQSPAEKLARQAEEKVATAERALASKDLELKLAKQQLEKLEQSKSKFISVTTHQLRTPLSAIKWTFNMMLSGQIGAINEEQRTFLEKAYESTQHIISIVNNLLNLDHSNLDDSELNISKMDIDKLIENTIGEFSNQLESKDIELVIKKPRRDLPVIEADPGQIKIVVENLLDNAIKYTPKGGQVTLQIKDDRINTARESLEVIVSDSGIGIPEEEQKKIFQKFFRATNAVAGVPDGSGIGLFITKGIIDRHQGTIWFESVAGKGASFHFILPLRHQVKAKQAIPSNQVATPAPAPAVKQTETKPGPVKVDDQAGENPPSAETEVKAIGHLPVPPAARKI